MLVSDIPRRNAEFFGDADAVVDPGTGRRSSWSEMDDRANRFAGALAELGLGKGDRLAIFAPNCAEYLDFFFGCARSGVIGAALNVRLAPAEIASYLNYVEPTAILVHSTLGEQADGWLGEVPSLRHVVGLGEGHGRDADLEQLLEGAAPQDPGTPLREDDIYQLGATSGTTGVPKGAAMTNGNAVGAMLNWAAEISLVERGTYLQCIPLFFNPGGPAGLHPVFLKGGRSVVHPAFDPAVYVRSVGEWKVTDSVLVPTMVGMVLDQLNREAGDLSSLRSVVIGGSPLPRPLLARARDAFGDVFFPFYGMAETYSSGLVLRREEQYTEGTEAQLRHLSSAGKPMALMQVRVVDEEGRDVPRDNETAGEIRMRGDSVSPEYFRMADETAAAHDGDWLRTGDVGVVDEDGFVTIVDRIKDIIITGGINVFSREVEEALHAHEAVAAAAVIGIPHEQWGEAIHAVVVLRPDGAATEDALLAFSAQRLASYKKPLSCEIVDALPMNANGKVLKRELRAPFLEATTAAS